MNYRVIISATVKKQIEALPDDAQERVLASLMELAVNPRPPGAKELKGNMGWRFRVGSHRLIYWIDDGKACVTLIKVGHRRDIYR